jgi:protein-L-isoaspartate(D-aspartate) O-methyltransferase
MRKITAWLKRVLPMSEPLTFREQREKMVVEQLVARHIHDKRVLEAMRKVPRHCFVPPEYQAQAYADCPLPIGEGQTISQPYIVALMTELLELEGDEKVLEIGTGSGYQAALLASLAKEVHTVERHAPLVEHAREVLKHLNYNNAQVHHSDGSLGLPKEAPFDGIVVTAASPEAPKHLLEQLTEGAHLVLPVGDYRGQVLQRWQRTRATYIHDDIVPVAFVPLRGEHGWEENEWGR